MESSKEYLEFWGKFHVMSDLKVADKPILDLIYWSYLSINLRVSLMTTFFRRKKAKCY